MRKALVPQRIRTISGSFASIEHRFLRHGFWTTLGHHDLHLYFQDKEDMVKEDPVTIYRVIRQSLERKT